ncbi:MAG: hypothetical protein Q7S40_16175 [Opitutaceae bacterium]|nr:hypothetical protein [Opitutaceae bacterium]
MLNPAAAPRVVSALLLLMTAAGGAFAAPASTAKTKRAADMVWTIGVYTGASPFDLQPASGVENPAFMPADTAGALDIVAHPFLAIEGSRYHLFFTAKNSQQGTGAIGHAESANGLNWAYRGIVLREPAVLSYPCVFKWRDDYYMVPESTENVIRLYRATRFPDEWHRVADVVKGDKLVSPTVVRHGDAWWLFVGRGNATLRLFRADELTGPWVEHPRSPIVENDLNIARPAGRPLLIDGRLFRLAQDCEPTYGNQVCAFEITLLSATEYAEKPVERSLVRASSSGWNAAAMHHVDAHRLAGGEWLAVVDALGSRVTRIPR